MPQLEFSPPISPPFPHAATVGGTYIYRYRYPTVGAARFFPVTIGLVESIEKYN